MISLKQFHEENSGPPTQGPEESAEIEILLAGVIFGPYTEEKIRERLAEDLLTPADQARFAESEGWVKLEELLQQFPVEKPAAASPRAPALEAPSSGFLTGPIPHFTAVVAASPEPAEEEEPAKEEEAEPPAAIPAPKKTALIPPPKMPAMPWTPTATAETEEVPKTKTSSGPLPPPPPLITSPPRENRPARAIKVIPPSAPGETTLSGRLRSKILAHTAREPLKTSTPLNIPGPAIRQIQIRSRTRMLPSMKAPVASGSAPALPPGALVTQPMTTPSEAAAGLPFEPENASAPSSDETPRAPQSPRPVLMGPESPLNARRKEMARPRSLPGAPPFAASSPPVSASSPGAGLSITSAPASASPETLMSRQNERPADEPSSAEDTIKKTGPLPLTVSSPPSLPDTEPPARAEAETPTAAPASSPSEIIAPAEKSTSEASASSAFLPPPLPAAPTPPAKAERRPPTPLSSVLAVRLPARKTQKLHPAPPLPGMAGITPEKTPRVVSHFPSLPTPKAAVTTTGPMTAPGGITRSEGESLKSIQPPPQASNLPAPPLPFPPQKSSESRSEPDENSAPITVAKLASLAAPHAASASSSAPARSATTIHLVPPPAKPATSSESSGSSSASASPSAEPAVKDLAAKPVEAATSPDSGGSQFQSLEPVPPTPKRTPVKPNRRQRLVLLSAAIGLGLLVLLCLGIVYHLLSTRPSSASQAPEPKTPAAAPQPTPSSSPPPTAKPSVTTTAAAPPPPPTPPPTDPQVAAHFTTGMADQASGNYDGAISEFTQAIQLNPKFAQGYSYRATARMSKGDQDGAFADENQLLALEPNNAGAYSQRAFIEQSKGDTDAATTDYSHAIELDPKLFIAFYNRGLIHEQKGEFDPAMSDYNQAITLNPQLAAAYYHRGNAKVHNADLDGAIADYTQALQINPKLALAFCNRALAEQNSGKLDNAIADYTASLAADPSIAMAYYNRGLIEEQQKNLQGSIDDSTKALELDPSNAQAYYNRGVALQAKGNLDAALNDLQKFAQLSPKDPYADYSHLYLWVIGNEQQHKTDADRELAQMMDSTWNAGPNQLPSQIGDFLLGRVTESALVTTAVSPDPKKDQGQHCEVWYFVGIVRLLKGDKAGAIEDFRRCVATGEKDYCEYILSTAELQTLDPNRPA